MYIKSTAETGGTLSSGRCPYVACGCCRLRAAGNARQHPRGARQKPGSGPVHSLTLDGPIESSFQIYAAQLTGAFETRQGASIAAQTPPGDGPSIGHLGLLPFCFFLLVPLTGLSGESKFSCARSILNTLPFNEARSGCFPNLRRHFRQRATEPVSLVAPAPRGQCQRRRL